MTYRLTRPSSNTSSTSSGTTLKSYTPSTQVKRKSTPHLDESAHHQFQQPNPIHYTKSVSSYSSSSVKENLGDAYDGKYDNAIKSYLKKEPSHSQLSNNHQVISSARKNISQEQPVRQVTRQQPIQKQPPIVDEQPISAKTSRRTFQPPKSASSKSPIPPSPRPRTPLDLLFQELTIGSTPGTSRSVEPQKQTVVSTRQPQVQQKLPVKQAPQHVQQQKHVHEQQQPPQQQKIQPKPPLQQRSQVQKRVQQQQQIPQQQLEEEAMYESEEEEEQVQVSREIHNIPQQRTTTDQSLPDEYGDPNVVLVPCKLCGRRFAKDRLPKHELACKKLKQVNEKIAKKKKEPNFIPDELMEDYQRVKKEAATESKFKPKEPQKKVPKWKIESQNFRAAMKHVATIDDRQQCPHCSRKFADQTYQRHILHCKNSIAKPTLLKRGEGISAGRMQSNTSSTIRPAPRTTVSNKTVTGRTGRF